MQYPSSSCLELSPCPWTSRPALINSVCPKRRFNIFVDIFSEADNSTVPQKRCCGHRRSSSLPVGPINAGPSTNGEATGDDTKQDGGSFNNSVITTGVIIINVIIIDVITINVIIIIISISNIKV